MTPDRRTVVLDSSVLFLNPAAPQEYWDAGCHVVIPSVVMKELDDNKSHPEKGYYAREATRRIERISARVSLHEPWPMGKNGGTLRIDFGELGASSDAPRDAKHDTLILRTAERLSADGPVVLVSDDGYLRIRARGTAAGVRGVLTAEQHVPAPVRTDLPAFVVSQEDVSRLFRNERVEVVDLMTRARASSLPVHAGLVLTTEEGGKVCGVGRVTADGTVRLVPQEAEAFGVAAHSPEQALALSLLRDKSIPLVSLGGAAGTGKSALALLAGLDAVLERREHKRLVVFRPLYAVGGQELGYLPGDSAAKMGPWAQAVFDTLGSLVAPEVVEEVLARDLLDVLPLTHIRGRSLHDVWAVVDEAQGLPRGVLLTVMSRMGQNSKIVLTHDVAQGDNPLVGRNDGVAAVLRDLEGHPLIAQVVLTQQKRSPLAALAGDLLDGKEVVKGRRPVAPPPLDRVPTKPLPLVEALANGAPPRPRGAAGNGGARSQSQRRSAS